MLRKELDATILRFWPLLSTVSVFLISFLLRIRAFWFDRPLWTDEFSTWIQSEVAMRYGLEVWSQDTFFFETHNITTHFLIGLSKLSFGNTLQAALLPIFIAGVSVPAVVSIVVSKHVNRTTGLVSGLLLASSYMQVAWSVQLRGYVLQQLLIWCTLFLYLQWFKNVKKWQLVVCGVVAIFLLATHILLGIFFIALGVHYLIWYALNINARKAVVLALFGTVLGLGVFGSTGALAAIWGAFIHGAFALYNNLWFYHAFLWREYSLVVFLAGIGIFLGLRARNALITISTLHFILHMGVITFLLGPYVSRYTLPVFPYLYVAMAYAVVTITDALFEREKKWAGLIAIVVTLGVIAQGHTFVRKPEQFLSVNYDMRQIAVIDYDQVYDIVLAGVASSSGDVALVDTWWDRSRFYLGTDYPHLYGYRWEDTGEFTNGLPQKTQFRVNQSGEKFIPRSGLRPIRFIGGMQDLQAAMTEYQQGYLFIDDSTLPADVQQYARESMQLELELDSYVWELNENPYSRWPARLYSWGMSTENSFYNASKSARLETDE